MENPEGGGRGVIVLNKIFEKKWCIWELNIYLHPLARG